MKLVKHLLDTKGRNVISISPDASVFDAIKLMADKAIGSLVVLDEGGKLAGIVTDKRIPFFIESLFSLSSQYEEDCN